jgi:hypothetical protein
VPPPGQIGYQSAVFKLASVYLKEKVTSNAFLGKSKLEMAMIHFLDQVRIEPI